MSYSLMIAPFDFANHKKIAAQQFLYDLYRFSEDEFDPIKPSYWDSW